MTLRAKHSSLLAAVLAAFGFLSTQGSAQQPASEDAQLTLAIQAAAQQRAFTYRDFNVDLSRVTRTDLAGAIRSTMHQIDIVESVQVKPAFRAFFKTITIRVAELSGTHGHYGPKGLELAATTEISDRPILLHELLHGVHHKMMPQSFRNADILRFYERAKSRSVYLTGSYVLKNEREFFAMTASLFLWGRIERPPHTREQLKAAQPVYYKYLGELFGNTPLA